MWKKEILMLEDISITSESIHVVVQVIPDPNPWLLTPICASNDFDARVRLWEEISEFAKTVKGDWFVGVISMRSLKLARKEVAIKLIIIEQVSSKSA